MIKGQKNMRTEYAKSEFLRGGGKLCYSNQYCRDFGIIGLFGKIQRRGCQLL